MSLDAPVRVMIVDDHPVVREGLRCMLTGDSVIVVAEAGTGADALRLAVEQTPEVVLLDMQLPDMDGLAVLRGLRETRHAPAVLVLSMHDDPARVRRAMVSGASGYLLKGATRQALLGAVRAVRDGGRVLDPAVMQDFLAPAPTVGHPTGSGEALNSVEHEVLRHMAEGLTNREISERMRWSVATAKKYVQRVFEKLGVSDRAQAVAFAMRRGLLS